MDIITINKNDPRFPEALKAIGDECPETIYAMGDVELLKSTEAVAIIGSRRASRQGNNAAYSLGKKLAPATDKNPLTHRLLRNQQLKYSV